MPQKRFWNWKADDLTVDLDRWLYGIIEKGVLRGFDFQPTADMNLKLVHTVTGTQFYFADKTQSPMTGVLVSPMGVIIQDDTEISLPVSPGDATNPRIDLVVCSSEYTYEDGGEDAVYQIIPGTPAATPVAPAVFDEGTDVIIGTLYIPAGTTVLADPDVVYTRTEQIPFADQNYAHRDKPNRFTKQQQWASEANATYDTSSKTVFIDDTSNSFVLPTSVTQSPNYLGYMTYANGSMPVAGTQIRIRVTATAGLYMRHQVSVAGSFNNRIDNDNQTFTNTSWIVVESDGTQWIVVDYSLNSVWDRNNVFKAAQQASQTKGCRIISKPYVVASVTYNRFILELDPISNYYLLDLDDSAQMGTYNPVSDFLSLHISEPTSFKQINGINAYIKIVSTSSTKRLAFISNIANPTPPSGIGTGFIEISNLSDLYNQSSTLIGPSIYLTREDTFYIKGINDHFFLESLTAVAKNAGSRIYQDASGVISDGDSHKDALKKILEVVGNSVYGDTFGILIDGHTHKQSFLDFINWLNVGFSDSTPNGSFRNQGSASWTQNIATLSSGSPNTILTSNQPGLVVDAYKLGDMVFMSGRIPNLTLQASTSGSQIVIYVQDLPNGYKVSPILSAHQRYIGMAISGYKSSSGGKFSIGGFVMSDNIAGGNRLIIIVDVPEDGSLDNRSFDLTFQAMYKSV